MHGLYNFVRGPLAWVAFILFFGGRIILVILIFGGFIGVMGKFENILDTKVSQTFSFADANGFAIKLRSNGGV